MHEPLSHFTNPAFWKLYNRLPEHIRDTADKNFAILKSNPGHPSLHLKKIGDLWSIRVGMHYRALGVDVPSSKSSIVWFWIGSHDEYDRLIKQN